ncbi:MAG TPA: S41 family peptidase [Ignavibacteria bacterium]|nr:S41 family peptidase [Ignavibacteria bacterium]
MKFLILIIMIMFIKSANSQEKTLTKQEKDLMLKNFGVLLSEKYVFPDIGIKMKEYLDNSVKSGSYDDVNFVQEFTMKLKQDLQNICKDKHLQLNFNPENAKLYSNENPQNSDPELDRQYLEEMKFINYGIEKIERLKGNIGYIDIRLFPDINIAKDKYISSMKMLEDTEVLIIDLRKHSGGDPSTVQFLCSYFFEGEPFLLNSIYNRLEDKTRDYFTLNDLPGKKLPNVDIYILTSKFTFSGAEEFAYNLKNLKRATIIGEVTGGGANPVTAFNVDDKFVALIPTGRAINPITKTNWEGVGVEPDIKTTNDKAFDIAYLAALKSLAKNSTELNKKFPYDWIIESIEAKVENYILNETEKSEYSGKYGERIITIENGNLIYERPGVGVKTKLIPMKKDLFAVESVEYFRIRFIRDQDGNIIELMGLYDNGMKDKSKKE